MPRKQTQKWLKYICAALLLVPVLAPCSVAQQQAQSNSEQLCANTNDPQTGSLFTANIASADGLIATDSGRPTVAIAFGGGGAKAAANIGVLKVLKQEGIPIDFVAGTSIGSTVGGLYCTGMSIEEIEDAMVSGKLQRAILPSMPTILCIQVAHHLEFWRHSYGGLLSQRRFKKRICKYCGTDRQFKDLKTPFTAVAVNLMDGKECDITSGDLCQGMAASCALSPLYKPVPIGDKLLVDGGIVANLPIRAARNMGADIVIGVCVDTTLHPIEAEKMRSLRHLTGRVTDIFMWSKDEISAAEANLTIYPNVDDVKVIERHSKNVRYAIEQGEIAARKALPYIKEMMKTVPHNQQRTAAAL